MPLRTIALSVFGTTRTSGVACTLSHQLRQLVAGEVLDDVVETSRILFERIVRLEDRGDLSKLGFGRRRNEECGVCRVVAMQLRFQRSGAAPAPKEGNSTRSSMAMWRNRPRRNASGSPVPCRETGDEECIEALVIAGEKRVQLRAHQWLHDEPHVPPGECKRRGTPATSSSATAREVDVVLDVDVLVRELFELREPPVQLAIAEARALGRGVLVRDDAQPREQLADAVVLEHHHAHGILHRAEKRRRCRPVRGDGFLQLADVGEEDLLFLEHVRHHVVGEIPQQRNARQLGPALAVHAQHLVRQGANVCSSSRV